MRVQDGGFPAKIGDQRAELTIKVIRNKFTPTFEESSYSASIRQDLGFGNSVIMVSAVDQDEQVKMAH